MYHDDQHGTAIVVVAATINALKVVSKIPVIQVREMESLLQINSGSTAVLGGLMEDTIQRNSDRVPGLSNLPVVGKAFRGQDDLTKFVFAIRSRSAPASHFQKA